MSSTALFKVDFWVAFNFMRSKMKKIDVPDFILHLWKQCPVSVCVRVRDKAVMEFSNMGKSDNIDTDISRTILGGKRAMNFMIFSSPVVN